MTTTATTAIRRIERPEAGALAAAEYLRVVDVLKSLDAGDWHRPTDCPAWDVRAMSGHILGAARTFSSLRQLLAHLPAAALTKGKRDLVDSLTDLQVRRNAALEPAAVIAGLAAVGPVNARWRSSRRLLRLIPLRNPMPDGSVETWSLGYLFDVILTRDPWMHRVDIARATDRPMVLTAQHDGRIVADVVAEWAVRHGRPFTLQLDGPAGGRYQQGDGGPELNLDAVEFCRILSGRAAGDGLLRQFVPF